MGVLPAYSVTSLHFEHSVAPGAEKVFAGHILQLKPQENTIKLDSKVRNQYQKLCMSFGKHWINKCYYK